MKYPPLKVWISAAIFLTAILTLLYSYQKSIAEFFFNKRIETVFREDISSDEDIKVVILCSSISNKALSEPKILSQMMSQRHGVQFSFIKLFKQMGDFEDFVENEFLIDQINSIEADYVVLQENHVFFKNHNQDRKYIKLNDFGLKEIHGIPYLRGLIFGFNNVYRPDSYDDRTNYIFQMDSTAEKIFPKRSKKLRNQNLAWKKFCKVTKGEKIILNIPLPATLEKKYERIRESKNFRKMINKKNSKGRFIFFNGSHNYPFKYYEDVNHMNQLGEEEFSNWFLDELYDYHFKKSEKKN